MCPAEGEYEEWHLLAILLSKSYKDVEGWPKLYFDQGFLAQHNLDPFYVVINPQWDANNDVLTTKYVLQIKFVLTRWWFYWLVD